MSQNPSSKVGHIISFETEAFPCEKTWNKSQLMHRGYGTLNGSHPFWSCPSLPASLAAARMSELLISWISSKHVQMNLRPVSLRFFSFFRIWVLRWLNCSELSVIFWPTAACQRKILPDLKTQYNMIEEPWSLRYTRQRFILVCIKSLLDKW